jgi:hypothetical protein
MTDYGFSDVSVFGNLAGGPYDHTATRNTEGLFHLGPSISGHAQTSPDLVYRSTI